MNRKFFSGESTSGAKLFADNNIIRLEEVGFSQCDEWMKNCGKLEIEGIDEESKDFLKA